MSSKDEAGSPACKKKKTLSDYFSSSVPQKQSTEDTDGPKEVTCNEEIKTAQPYNEQAVQILHFSTLRKKDLTNFVFLLLQMNLSCLTRIAKETLVHFLSLILVENDNSCI